MAIGRHGMGVLDMARAGMAARMEERRREGESLEEKPEPPTLAERYAEQEGFGQF